MRRISVPTSFLATPLVVSAISVGVLIAYPGNLQVWKVGAWSLVVCLVLLIVLLPVTAYSLATNAAARTWPRVTAFGLGLAYLAVLIASELSSGF